MGNKTFKILSIDGGGIKGLYSSTILEHFERKYDCLTSDCFDLLCGTSTGGIIVLAISQRLSASIISDFYINKGGKIFPEMCRPRSLFRQLLYPGKYSDETLRKSLEEIFGDKKIGESNNLLCIPSYSITDARPWVFKYDHGDLSRDNNTPYVDVALATTAAPTFLPIAEITCYNKKQFIDGGVWANNPTLTGLIEALKFFVGEDKEFKAINILSISSLTHIGGKPVGLKRKRGFLGWRQDLFETALTGQSFFTDYFMNTIMNVSRIPIFYYRIPSVPISAKQERLVQLDNANDDALNFIRGKGNDVGFEYGKTNEIKSFFQEKKKFVINK